jgi:DNA-binding NarL/FixJ family response regulator
MTGRELQILTLVAQGYSSPQIAGMLQLSAATVDRHRANLMQKLDLHSVPALVLFAARSGLVDLKRATA